MVQTSIEGSGTLGGGSPPDAAAPSIVGMINRVNRRLGDVLLHHENEDDSGYPSANRCCPTRRSPRY